MRYVFVILLALHGMIHLMGFVKALSTSDMSKQVLGISKPIGSVWLLVFILFMVSASQFLNHKKWFYLAFIAVFVSQILIIMTWKEAKFGTIANSIILLVSMSAFATEKFNKKVELESQQMLQNITVKNLSVAENDIKHLPQIIQKWMLNSGVVGKQKVCSVQLKQIGEMRTKPNNNWMSFEATQSFNVENPAFIWTTKVDAAFGVTLVGRDKLENGKGEMLIKFGGLLPVVNEGNNPKINQGAMLRYLAEICWFPSAALNDYLSWEIIDEFNVKATLTLYGKSVSGLFEFNYNSDIISFEANRYFGGEENARLEKWVITMDEYKDFGGVTIPNKCNVTWKLSEGDFSWLNLKITAITYNGHSKLL